MNTDYLPGQFAHQSRFNPGFGSKYDLGLIVTEAFRLFKEGFSRYILVYLLIQMPLTIVQLITLSANSEPMPQDPTAMLSFVLTAVFFGFLSLFVTINLIAISADQLIAIDRPFHQRFLYSLSRFPVAVFAAIVFAVVVFTGCIALIIPGIIFGIYGSLFLQIIVLRDKGVISSLVQSYELVKGNWWRVFGTQLLLVAVSLLVAIPLGITELVLSLGLPFQIFEYAIYGLITIFAVLINIMMVLNLEAIKAPQVTPPVNFDL